MTENNKIKEQKINELAEAFKKKDNPKNDNTLNGVILPDDEGTNIEGLENDIKKLEEEIFTDKNLENIKADEGSDLYNFLSGKKEDGGEYTINNIIDNTYNLSEAGITNFLINNKVYKKDQFCSEHGFVAALLNGKAGHFCTYENRKIIFNSIEDGRQPIDATTGKVKEQGCGIHAIEGVLIAEALTEKSKNIEEFKQEHKKLTETSLDDLIEQRKILFKMEILDALISMVQTGKKIEITPPENIDGLVLCGDENRDEKQKNEDSIACINKLYELYFEEFQARCAALQAVKKELGLKLDKVKLDKVPEAQKVETQKVETPKQSDPAAVIQQENKVTPEAPKVEMQQTKIKKEETPKIETEVQKPATRIVVENPEEEIEQKKEDKPKYKTVAKNKEEAKKLDLTEPKQENVAVNTQKTTEEEPCSSRDTESSNASSTSTNKAPRYKVLERKEGAEDKDAGFETYDVNNQPIDIENESVKLYNKFLDQVLEEFKKEGKIANIDLIKKKVEEKLFACFSIRDEKGEIISEDNYSDKDKKDIALAKEDYKYTAEHSELIQNHFNTIEKALKEYNERLTGANKEMGEKVLKETATASIKM